jgi:hypothetical protein
VLLASRINNDTFGKVVLLRIEINVLVASSFEETAGVISRPEAREYFPN